MATVSVALCLTVVGCGSGRPNASEAAALAEHVGTYQASADGGDGALLEGTVRVVGGCLTVRQGDAGDAFLPLFPDDEVRWSRGRLDYDGQSYSDGDAIALTGGSSGWLDEVVIPKSCDATALTPWTVAAQ